MAKAIRLKKAQLVGEVLKYALVGAMSVFMLVIGYKMVDIVKEKACKAELVKFEVELKGIDKSLRFGAKELRAYDAPCKVNQIYFFDLNKNINPDSFNEIPLIKDALESSSDNVFLINEGKVKQSFYAGNLEMLYPYYICFTPKFDKISFFVEGAGKTAKIASACEQPECTLIPVEISEEDSKKIVKEAFDFGCRNCPSDFDKEIENIKLTRQNVDIFRKFLYCDGITDIQIIIRPKKGSEVRDFRFYEFIPKDCIDDLNKYLAESIEGNVEVKGDPLIMWYFDEISGEKKISYKLSAELNDECRQAIQGLGVAQFIEGKKPKEEQAAAEGQRAEPGQEASNTAPTIGSLPDALLSGIGLKKNAISNLWRYAQDRETDPKNLVYTIIDQTNPNLVDCSINNEKHVDCEVKQNKYGASRVTIQVDDLQFADRASFNVKVEQFCKKHERKSCAGNYVYWFDSCGKQEEPYEICSSDERCENGECKEESASSECERNSDCGFLGKCKNGKCCAFGQLNPFC